MTAPQGATRLRLSAIGLGCVTFGREIDRVAAWAMMDQARARGVTHFDTAAAYSAGGSETIVGEWLAERGAAEIVVGTKILPPYTPAGIEALAEACARRLGVETIPLLYLHRWDDALREQAVLAALGRLVERGRVGALGASNFTAGQVREMVRGQDELGGPTIRAVQNIHNFAVRGVDEALRRLCAERQIAIVTYSPLGAGFLSGKHEAGVVPGSRFAIMPAHQDIYFTAEARSRLAHLQQLAARTQLAITQLALAWALRQPQTACVLVGGRTPAHLDQALDALTGVPDEVLAELADA